MFSPGTLVWAKVRGYPWWPGQVKSLSDVPPELADYARHNYKKIPIYPIHFFGSHDFALIAVDSVMELDEKWEEFSNKSASSKFKQAIDEARRAKERGSGVPAPKIPAKTAPIAKAVPNPEVDVADLNEEDLPTNAFIEIDPETGTQTLKKRRGRPPKVRPDDLPAIQIKEKKKKNAEGKNKKLLKLPKLLLLRKKLQKCLMRPIIRSKEIPIACDILRLIFVKRQCTQDLLERSGIGFLLVQAMRRGKAWEPYPEAVKGFKLVLDKWKSLPE